MVDARLRKSGIAVNLPLHSACDFTYYVNNGAWRIKGRASESEIYTTGLLIFRASGIDVSQVIDLSIYKSPGAELANLSMGSMCFVLHSHSLKLNHRRHDEVPNH